MRILRVISSMDPSAGGPPQGIRNILPYLDSLGIHQEIVCLDTLASEYLKKECVSIQALGPSRTSFAYSQKLKIWLERNLKGFDGVICHGLWQYPLFAVRCEIGRLRTKGDAPKFYVYPHGMLDPWFQCDPSRRMKALRNDIYWRFVEKRNLNSADAVLFTCEEERRLAGTTFPGYRATEEVVGYGIPSPPEMTLSMLEAFRSGFPALRSHQSYFLFLSRLHPKKGVDLLIHAYAKLARQGPQGVGAGAFPALVIAGPLDSDYAIEMQQLAEQQMGLETNGKIVFAGMLQGDAKWGAIYGAEAFVLPSHQENFGIAVVEALACGTPVLISDKVNIWREIVESGGGLVGADDQKNTVDLLDRWMAMGAEERAAMKHNARKAFEDKFAAEPAAKKLADFLFSNRRVKSLV